MTECKDLIRQNMVWTLVLWCFLGVAGMTSMLIAASGKVIVIADAGQEQTVVEESREQLSGGLLMLKEESGESCQLTIPLDAGTKAENVVIENRYTDRELWIYLQQADYSFYEDNPIEGDISWVQSAWYEVQEKGIILKLAMSEVLEYRNTLENDSLRLALFKPAELYEQLVVIDPVGGEIPCQVAKLLQKKINEDSIRIYFTRTEETVEDDGKGIELAEAVDADLYLQLGLSEAWEKPECYGIQSFYNEEYFIPGFGNVQWADCVTRKVTIAASNQAIGLLPVEGDSTLGRLRIPAAQIKLGFISNKQEAALLQQESYQEKLAQGIAEAILEAYSVNNKEEQQEERADE